MSNTLFHGALISYDKVLLKTPSVTTQNAKI